MARIRKTLEERRRYQNQYKIDHTVKFTIRFINDKDQDIIDKLQSQQNKTDYLRRLVREDIERGGK